MSAPLKRRGGLSLMPGRAALAPGGRSSRSLRFPSLITAGVLVAVYRFSAQIIGRSGGRSATGAAAYRAGERIEDERTGLAHDYTRKGGVLHSEILAPADTPAWMRDRAQLWNAVERIEKRKDAQLCREILLSLPNELSHEQRVELAREFVREEFVARGMVADIAVHAPHREGDDRNHHAHVMLTMRELTGAGFGNKARDWNSPELLEHWRERWAAHQNRALERAGSRERVDHRSLEARGIDREPEPKQGPVATQMEREGRKSKAGDDRRATQARNRQREELRAEAKVIDLQLARLKREEQQRQPRRQADHGRQREREIEREKGRFEREANTRRAEQQNRRIEETGDQQRRHAAERLVLEDQLERLYGGQEKALQKEAREIADRQQQAKGWRGAVYRVTGGKQADAIRQAGIAASLASIEQRKAEQVQALEARQGQEKTALARQHAEQERQLERRIDQRRAEREAEGWRSRETVREATTGREIDAEAEKLTVEGRENSAGETTPEQEQATTAQPEAAQQPEKTQTAEDERQARIDAIRAARIEREQRYQEARERGDTGRVRTR